MYIPVIHILPKAAYRRPVTLFGRKLSQLKEEMKKVEAATVDKAENKDVKKVDNDVKKTENNTATATVEQTNKVSLNEGFIGVNLGGG